MIAIDPRLISSAGLLLDIAGAVLVIRGFIRLRDVDMSNASVHGAILGGGINEDLHRILRSSRTDARWGGSLLVFGFAIQLIAMWLPRLS